MSPWDWLALISSLTTLACIVALARSAADWRSQARQATRQRLALTLAVAEVVDVDALATIFTKADQILTRPVHKRSCPKITFDDLDAAERYQMAPEATGGGRDD